MIRNVRLTNIYNFTLPDFPDNSNLTLKMSDLKFVNFKKFNKICIITESHPFTMYEIVKKDEAMIEVAQGVNKFQLVYLNAGYECMVKMAFH